MKTITPLNLIAVFIGLTIGNFVYQSFTTKDDAKAIDHSIFQLTALIAVWFVAEKPNS
jgi:hypothetical protein